MKGRIFANDEGWLLTLSLSLFGGLGEGGRRERNIIILRGVGDVASNSQHFRGHGGGRPIRAQRESIFERRKKIVKRLAQQRADGGVGKHITYSSLLFSLLDEIQHTLKK